MVGKKARMVEQKVRGVLGLHDHGNCHTHLLQNSLT